MATNKNRNTKIAVIGGGLVGALEACYLASDGYDVHLYEYRKDIRQMEHVPGRSINLAMSIRGLSALDPIGLKDHIIQEYGIPMSARMIHKIDGGTYSIPYGKSDQCIYSVGRRYLNEILLTAGEKYKNLHYHFEHKLINLSLDSAEMTFEVVSEVSSVVKRVTADLVIGCDGAYSNVRKAFVRLPWFNFSQTYINHAYMELCIPPVNNEYAMAKNFLHIWPRGQFMLIALPNQDKSFTVTLFMPKTNFDSLTNADELLAFFKSNFNDALNLIGEARLVETFFRIEPAPLISIKCSQFHWSDKCLILGDAAHAIVPFYGQGMNSGMEDVLILDQMLKKFPDDRKQALEQFSKTRTVDAHAICDLAMYNYIEMRDLVARPSFLLRKKLDSVLNWLFPSLWVPLYTTVTFSRMPYHKCIENKQWQDKLLERSSIALTVSGLVALQIVLVKNRDMIKEMLLSSIGFKTLN